MWQEIRPPPGPPAHDIRCAISEACYFLHTRLRSPCMHLHRQFSTVSAPQPVVGSAMALCTLVDGASSLRTTAMCRGITRVMRIALVAHLCTSIIRHTCCKCRTHVFCYIVPASCVQQYGATRVVETGYTDHMSQTTVFSTPPSQTEGRSLARQTSLRLRPRPTVSTLRR